MAAKTISHFLPVSTRSRQECDRHYVEVHTRFARRFLREMDDVVTYHVGLATAEYDLSGDWLQEPRAFRFIVMRTSGGPLRLPPRLGEVIAQDHRNFLRELRQFSVAEDVVVDELRGQTALVKYLFEFDRADTDDPATAGDRLAAATARLREETAHAFGLRLLVVNRVLDERATEPIDEPGQRPLPHLLPGTTKQAFVELWFDQQEWAEEWLRRPAVRDVLQDRSWALARGYRIDERCGLDRR